MTKQTIDYVGISNSNDSFGFYFSTEENQDLVYTSTWLLKDLDLAQRTKYNKGTTYMESSSMEFATEERRANLSQKMFQRSFGHRNVQRFPNFKG